MSPCTTIVHGQATGDGNPQWTSLTGEGCEATVYDQSHSRLFTGTDVTMTFTY
jgi:hypothetical protein